MAIISATELCVGYRGSGPLQSISSVAARAMVYKAIQQRTTITKIAFNKGGINARLIGKQFGLRAAETNRRLAVVRRESNECGDREQAAVRAARKTIFESKAIKNAVVRFGRALCQRATRTSSWSRPTSHLTYSSLRFRRRNRRLYRHPVVNFLHGLTVHLKAACCL